MRHLAVPVRGPNELFAVGGEHGEGIEGAAIGDLLEVLPVEVDGVNVELPAARIFVVRGEDYAFVVGEEEGREGAAFQVRDLLFIFAIRIDDEKLEPGGAVEAVFQVALIGFLFFGRLRVEGAVDELLAVVGEEGAAVVAQILGHALHTAPYS